MPPARLQYTPVAPLRASQVVRIGRVVRIGPVKFASSATERRIGLQEEFFVIAFQTDSIQLAGPAVAADTRILTPEAAQFLLKLSTMFESRRQKLLRARGLRQQEIDAGEMPIFQPDSADIRRSRWSVADAPADLCNRRVEITGPTDRKMIINALNSGANVFMADFEDSNSPTWRNMVDGQANLCDAVRGTIAYTS